MTNICPVCEVGELSPAIVTEALSYRGTQLVVPGFQVSRCSRCGEEVVLDAQAKANELLFADAKRHHDGLLTSREIKRVRKELGITQAQAASIFGGGANAFSKYERGEVIQSQAMDLLMRLAAELPVVRARLIPGYPSLSDSTVAWFPVGRGVTTFEDEIVAARSVQSGLLAAYHGSCANDSDWNSGGRIANAH